MKLNFPFVLRLLPPFFLFFRADFTESFADFWDMLLIAPLLLFSGDEDAAVKGVDHEYESDNSDCDSVATYSSGRFSW